MAYNQEPNLRFIPYRAGDFRNNRPIQQGGQLVTPWQKGVQDLVYNQLTLWGQTAPAVIQDCRTVTLNLPVQNTYYDFAMYRYDTPGQLNPGSASGRRYMQITMRAVTTGAHSWQFQARTSSGVTVASASSGAGGFPVQLTLNVNIPANTLGDWIILSVRCTSSALKDITISQITGRVMPASLAALGEGTAVYSLDEFHPVDSTVGQGAEGCPLTVQVVRDLILANQTLYEKNIRGVINFSAWDLFTSLPNSFVNVAALSNGVNINTFAGAGTLNVNSTTGFPPSGAIQVTTGSGVFVITYTGTTATTFTGCNSNGQAGVMATGGFIYKSHTGLGFTFDPDTSNQIKGHQWVYYPRPGVRNLRLYLDGYIQGWSSSSDTGSLAFGFANHDPVTFDIDKPSYLTAVTSWPAEGLLIPIPNRPGPLFLDLRRTDVRTKPLKVMSMSVMEESR
jgi:hypothetical protein